MRLQTQSRRIIPEFAVPVAPDPVDFRELSGSPKFPGNPRDHSPCSSTPAGPGTRYGTRGQRTRHGPRTKAKRGLLTVASFGAQSHGFWSRCLRLVVVVSHHCTQDSLPAAGPSLAGRDFHPQGFYERFLSINTRPPLPSFLGASFVLHFLDDRLARTACCSVNPGSTCQRCEPSSFRQPSLSGPSARAARSADQVGWFLRVKEHRPRAAYPLGRRAGLLLTPNWQGPSARSRHTELTARL